MHFISQQYVSSMKYGHLLSGGMKASEFINDSISFGLRWKVIIVVDTHVLSEGKGDMI